LQPQGAGHVESSLEAERFIRASLESLQFNTNSLKISHFLYKI
jgi:hypothetical protein